MKDRERIDTIKYLEEHSVDMEKLFEKADSLNYALNNSSLNKEKFITSFQESIVEGISKDTLEKRRFYADHKKNERVASYYKKLIERQREYELHKTLDVIANNEENKKKIEQSTERSKHVEKRISEIRQKIAVL